MLVYKWIVIGAVDTICRYFITNSLTILENICISYFALLPQTIFVSILTKVGPFTEGL